jgi:hypothetical protein
VHMGRWYIVGFALTDRIGGFEQQLYHLAQRSVVVSVQSALTAKFGGDFQAQIIDQGGVCLGTLTVIHGMAAIHLCVSMASPPGGGAASGRTWRFVPRPGISTWLLDT